MIKIMKKEDKEAKKIEKDEKQDQKKAGNDKLKAEIKELRASLMGMQQTIREKGVMNGLITDQLPSDMDKALAIDLRRLWSFLNATQSDKLKAYKGHTPLEENVPQQIWIVSIPYAFSIARSPSENADSPMTALPHI